MLLAVLIGGLIVGGAPSPAGAGHVGTKKCSIVSHGGSDYRVRATSMKCDPAERGAKRFLRSGKPLDGFSCTEAEGATPFFCKRAQQAYWAVLL